MGQRFSCGLDCERLASDVVGEFTSRILLGQVSEFSEAATCFFNGLKHLVNLSVQVLSDLVCPSFFSVFGCSFEMLTQTQLLGHCLVVGVVGANGCSDFRKIGNSLRWNHTFTRTHFVNGFRGFEADHFCQLHPQSINATISKLTGDGCDHGQVFIGDIELVSIASDLLSNGSKRIFTATLFVLVEDDHISHVKHLNLLELGVSTKFGSHDIERAIGN